MSQGQKILEAKKQILSCGVEYDYSLIVGAKAEDEGNDKLYPVSGTAYIDGIIRTGHRLLNGRVRCFADGTMWDIHHDLLANGSWRILVVSGDDFPDKDGRSLGAVSAICGAVVKKFP